MALALQALLAGGMSQQIPAALLPAMSRRMGNSGLLDLMDRRSRGPEQVELSWSETPLNTVPLEGGGEPALWSAPEFGSLSPLTTSPGGAYAEG